jgi:putative DNA primase/helicase
MADTQDQSLLKRDLAWHQTHILRQRQQKHQAPDNESYDPDYDDVLPAEPDLLKFRHSDTGNAKRFLALHWGFVRYSPARKEWLVWNGHLWKFSSLLAYQLAAQSMILFTQQTGENYNRDVLRFATTSQNARRLSALLEVARSFPNVAVELADLDKNPYLLNCPNGTLDLRAQSIHRHRPEDLITKTIETIYDSSAECPRWLTFLGEALGSEMVRYLQKIFGLCLSADVSEKAFFIFHGPKDAGKTQMLNAIRSLLGPYAGTLQVETLTARARNSSALADMAQLVGTRFVQTSELVTDMKLAGRVLKYLVQGSGSEIKATLKYANPERIRETWKTFIDCNALPDLEDPNDTAFLSRVHPIFFRNSVSPEKIDRNLPAKLTAELPGILSWAVRGFALWQVEGLQKPASVLADLDRWRQKSDSPSGFLKDCCTPDVGSVAAQALYLSYRAWCEKTLTSPVPPQVFAGRIERHYRKRRSKKGLSYDGLRLLEDVV